MLGEMDPVPQLPQASPSSANQAKALAERHGLRRLGLRPALGPNVLQLWRRRDCTWALATSDAYGKNQGSYLGQLWGVPKPLLQVAVFWVVFGGLMAASSWVI